ncbi:RNA polymerase sigma factor [Lunatibacter salilacus]|uniref:RNA polymerase sigma factor n=1 Tax=Lunatibacter salilacus TaxID=2483804 RepID=UPI00131C2A4A|nr:sigma-70 family RNA polymerase sigma factor [Lunatibacter salilacus]
MEKSLHQLRTGQVCDDFENWQKIRNNERTGLEAIYKKYISQLFSLGRSIVSDEDFVKDCIQDVFLDLWKYRNSIKTVDNFKLYLFKCLSHKIYRQIESSKMERGLLELEKYDVLYFLESAESDLIRTQIDQERSFKLSNAIDKLPARQREVIRYYFFDSFSYEQIAEVMKINVQSVYTLVWKAISGLKKSL